MNYTFDSIAGYSEEKEELKNFCEIIKNRDKCIARGAHLPKGIIFYGDVGTGKTLFSKVLASVCGLKVFKIDLGRADSISNICNVINRVFKQASKIKEPTMIFFDELDKVLPNEEEEYYTDRSKSILAQLLTLIDGMDSYSNIIFVATCNDYDALPKSLTRPGRIDKKIHIAEPNLASRVDILKMYTKRSKCTFEMCIADMAKLCAGFTCSALETLINECVLIVGDDNLVSRELILSKYKEIKNEDISRGTSMVGDTIDACRNLGSFVVARTLNGGAYTLSSADYSTCNDFFDSILSCYNDDYDDEYEDEDVNVDSLVPNPYYSKEDLLNTICVLLGGYVAEEIVMGKTYDNMRERLDLIDDILIDMSRQGMFGLGLRFSYDRHCSLDYNIDLIEKVNAKFDQVIDECYYRARAIIRDNIDLIQKLTPALVLKSKIEKKACEEMIEKFVADQV